jgi:hypothetical protein
VWKWHFELKRELAGLLIGWQRRRTVSWLRGTTIARKLRRKRRHHGEGIEYRGRARQTAQEAPPLRLTGRHAQAKSARRLIVLTYEDRRLKLGADREMRFRLTPAPLEAASAALRAGPAKYRRV